MKTIFVENITFSRAYKLEKHLDNRSVYIAPHLYFQDKNFLKIGWGFRLIIPLETDENNLKAFLKDWAHRKGFVFKKRNRLSRLSSLMRDREYYAIVRLSTKAEANELVKLLDGKVEGSKITTLNRINPKLRISAIIALCGWIGLVLISTLQGYFNAVSHSVILWSIPIAITVIFQLFRPLLFPHLFVKGVLNERSLPRKKEE